MASTELRQIDDAVLRCLLRQGDGKTPAELLPLLQQEFPESDEVEMREGIALTRLRGRTLVAEDAEGRIHLTEDGKRAAEALLQGKREGAPLEPGEVE